jgi:hypothetical protein
MVRAVEWKAALCALGCALMTVSADIAQADWHRMAGDDFVTVFSDKSTLAAEGPYIRVWTLWSYAEPQSDNRGFAYRSSKALLYADCEDGSIAFKAALQYGTADGSGYALSDDEKHLAELGFEVPVPHSIGELWVAALCPLKLTPGSWTGNR